MWHQSCLLIPASKSTRIQVNRMEAAIVNVSLSIHSTPRFAAQNNPEFVDNVRWTLPSIACDDG